MAEVVTLYLLGIGDLTEPYYWIFILLASIPFVLFCFLLVRLVAPLSFKDVLHLSFYPIGAGVFAGAAFALVVSAVLKSLMAVGFIPDIKFDFSQWREFDAIYRSFVFDCLKDESIVFSMIATGLQLPYINLRPPINIILLVRPFIAVLYFVVAASVITAAAAPRKPIVFGIVLLVGVLAMFGASNFSMTRYLYWKVENADCAKKAEARALDRVAESYLKDHARGLGNEAMGVSVKAEGRTLVATWRLKTVSEMGPHLQQMVRKIKEDRLKLTCSDNRGMRFLRIIKATQIYNFYGSGGEWLTSFSIGPGDCSQ